MVSPDPRSYLIIEVPEAEPAVGQHRQRLDSSAAAGVPAHITVLGPFMPPETIDAPVLAELERLFTAASRFRFQLDHTDWFGNDVLWLAPHDPGPFTALTQRVYQAFPGFPPFEGQFAEVIPHLTVGHGHPVSDLRAAEVAVKPHLPIDGQVTAVTLVTRQSVGAHWTTAVTFSLGA
jgi:hypothetical protein